MIDIEKNLIEVLEDRLRRLKAGQYELSDGARRDFESTGAAPACVAWRINETRIALAALYQAPLEGGI